VTGGRNRAHTALPSTVRLDEVSVFYGEVIGLGRVTLALGAGITGLVGPNGAGKSTLMRLLSGLTAPNEGRIEVLGGEPFHRADIRRRIGFVPATECFYEGLSARRNLEIAFLSQGHPKREARARAAHALERVELTGDGGRRYGTWSRGMRQRLKLGLVLAGEAELILLDEPFLGVDPSSRGRLREAIGALGASGRTVLISSHVLHDVEVLTRRVGILSHGRLLGMGDIGRLREELRDRHPHRVRLETDRPRETAARLALLAHVRELSVEGEVVEFLTAQPEVAYGEIPVLTLEAGGVIRRLETVDDGLEAVYRQVTEGGANRL
jgi:ABC-2 type transport system ATP-binding protein